jgi:hypothetical protein
MEMFKKCQKEKRWAISRQPAENGLSLPMTALLVLTFIPL